MTSGACSFVETEGAPVTNPVGTELAILQVNSCSGTLLNRDWILTARRCVSGPDGSPVESVVVAPSSVLQPISVSAASVYLHPDLAVDVALLHLPVSLDLGQPEIELFSRQYWDALGSRLASYGYGSTADANATDCSSWQANACKAGEVCDRYTGVCRTPGAALRTTETTFEAVSADGDFQSVVRDGKYIRLAATKNLLMGDIGGPSFFQGALIGVNTGSEFLALANSFRVWVRSHLLPVASSLGAPVVALASPSQSLGQPLAGDFDGDGLSDVAWIADATGERRGQVNVALALGDGTLGEPSNWNPWFIVADERPGVGDFDGDGRDDVVAFESAAGVHVALSNGALFAAAEPWQDFVSFSGEEPGVGDFNGDGRDDLTSFIRYQSWGQVWVTLSCAGAVQATGCQKPRSFGERQSWETGFNGEFDQPRIGDVNGDGVADLVTLTPAGELFVSLTRKQACDSDAQCPNAVCWSRYGLCPDTEGAPAVQDGWAVPHKSLWSVAFPASPAFFFMKDVDGDGNDDAVAFSTEQGITSGPFVALSTGDHFQVASAEWAEPLPEGAVPLVADMDGDGRAEFIYVVSGDAGTLVSVRYAL